MVDAPADGEDTECALPLVVSYNCIGSVVVALPHGEWKPCAEAMPSGQGQRIDVEKGQREIAHVRVSVGRELAIEAGLRAIGYPGSVHGVAPLDVDSLLSRSPKPVQVLRSLAGVNDRMNDDRG